MILALDRDLFASSCNFLACDYRIVYQILEYANVALFLPIVLAALWLHSYSFVWFVVTFFYWLAISYAPAILYSRIMRKPLAHELTEEERTTFEFQVILFYTSVFFIFSFFLTFLYYPRITLSISSSDFVVTASLIAILLTMYFNTHLGIQRNNQRDRAITLISLYSISLLVVGLFFSFMSQTSIGNAAQPIQLNNASEEALTVGSMSGGLVGLVSIVYAIIWSLKPKREEADEFILY